MTGKKEPEHLLDEAQYSRILDALNETQLGRDFLKDHLARNRSQETRRLLASVQRLEENLLGKPKPEELDSIRLGVFEMREAIMRTKQEIARITNEYPNGNKFTTASNELDAIVSSTENATQTILESMEIIQDEIERLDSDGTMQEIRNRVEELTTEVFMACSFQDLTGQRIQKVVNVLHYLEERVSKMVSIWSGNEDLMSEGPIPEDTETKDTRADAHLLNGPALEGEGVEQADIDALFDAIDMEEDLTQSHVPIPIESLSATQ